MWESSKHSHPRRGLGFMDEAAEDISCNIMPEPLPAPYIPPSLLPDVSSPLSKAHTDTRYFSFFFVPAMTIFFFFLLKGGGGWGLQAVLLWPTLWVHEKRNVGIVYTWMCESQTKYRIWASVAEQTFPVFVMMWTCAFCRWMKETTNMAVWPLRGRFVCELY